MIIFYLVWDWPEVSTKKPQVENLRWFLRISIQYQRSRKQPFASQVK